MMTANLVSPDGDGAGLSPRLPVLTVVIPTFNRAAMLRECVGSVLGPGNSDWEVVVADDASTEDIAGVCRALGETYGPARVLHSRIEQNRGAPNARNRGAALGTGRFVVFVDSDDLVESSGLAALVDELAKRPELDYAHGRVLVTDGDKRVIGSARGVGSSFTPSPVEVAGYHWHTMGIVYRRDYLARLGPWNEALTGSQDWEYQARVKLNQGRGAFVDAMVGYWRQHAGPRVGASAFRFDYVQSAIAACDRVMVLARETGYCDVSLERRIAKKLILHAMELGWHGRRAEKRACLDLVGRTLSGGGRLAWLSAAVRIMPGFADGVLWRLIRWGSRRRGVV